MKPYVETAIKYFAYTMIVIVMGIAILSFRKGNQTGEANIGELGSEQYNNGWEILVNGRTKGKMNLPANLSCERGDQVVMKNRLPQEIHDGMSLMVRTSIQDVRIYVDGNLRQTYASENLKNMSRYLPSAYVVTELSSGDADKEVEIQLTVRWEGQLNGVLLSEGDNGWFTVIKENIGEALVAIAVILLGTIACFVSFLLKDKLTSNRAIFYLSLLMDMMGVWILSESKLRQLVLARPSLSSIFSYLAVEIIGVLALLYFDEIQHHRYQKVYLILETILSCQIVANIVLNATGLAAFHRTLIYSHLEFVAGIGVTLILIGKDIRKKEIQNYLVAAMGIGFLLISGLLEILNFYLSSSGSFGTYLCFGVISMLFTTIIQLVMDVAKIAHEREKKKQESWIHTVETFVGAIEAKDEYTGGHSYRVGEYAEKLARGAASLYDFSEEDIQRIRYIGLMHDIGKIGVADPILNKVGRLTEEEFSLMKKHVEIGSILLSNIDDSMEGLLDGIRYHHERFDGHGYPDGLKGTEIPLIARILCLADCYDAMTSNRVYRGRLSDEEVKGEIMKCVGSQFDPALAEIFVGLIDSKEITPITRDGLAADEEGKPLRSAILADLLHRDVASEKGVVLNPNRVRMVCYIVKLAEYRKQNFEILMVKQKETKEQDISREELIKNNRKGADLCVQYSEDTQVLVLFERTKEQLEILCRNLSAAYQVTVLQEQLQESE